MKYLSEMTIISFIKQRYKDDLIIVGRHSLLIHKHKDEIKNFNSFSYKAEIVHELARAQRLLIKTYSFIVRKINKITTDLFSGKINNTEIKSNKLEYIEKLILDINILRGEIINDISILTDYPSMIVNIHLTNIFEETLKIGYGQFEYRAFKDNLRELDDLTIKVHNILEIKNNQAMEQELTLLNLMAIIGFFLDLVGTLWSKPEYHSKAFIWIIASICFGLIFFISLRIYIKMKNKNN